MIPLPFGPSGKDAKVWVFGIEVNQMLGELPRGVGGPFDMFHAGKRGGFFLSFFGEGKEFGKGKPFWCRFGFRGKVVLGVYRKGETDEAKGQTKHH